MLPGFFKKNSNAVSRSVNQHRIIAMEEMFRGTLDGASVHPREVVKSALAHNAAAVIFAHNHPSGVAEPSQTDLPFSRTCACHCEGPRFLKVATVTLRSFANECDNAVTNNQLETMSRDGVVSN